MPNILKDFIFRTAPRFPVPPEGICLRYKFTGVSLVVKLIDLPKPTVQWMIHQLIEIHGEPLILESGLS
jgi:hypothetical protein